MNSDDGFSDGPAPASPAAAEDPERHSLLTPAASISAFSLTVPQLTVSVDPTSRATSFTVTVRNAQSNADDVLTTVESDATGVTYTVDRPLRQIPSGGSEQYSVAVAVDPTVAAGSYPMKPVAFSDTRPPEETRSEGPAMTLA